MPRALLVISRAAELELSVSLEKSAQCTAYCFLRLVSGGRKLYLVSGTQAQLDELKKLPGPYYQFGFKDKPPKNPATRLLATDADIDKAQSMRALISQYDIHDENGTPE